MYIECPDLSENKFVSVFTNINNENYKFTFKWNEYCDCCFMSIFDSNGDEVRTGIALCTNELIHTDKRILPELLFAHKEGSKLQPTPETMKDYVVAYENTSE